MEETRKNGRTAGLSLFLILIVLVLSSFPVVYGDRTIYSNSVSDNGREISGISSHVRFDGEEVTATSSLVGENVTKIIIKVRWFSGLSGNTGTAYVGAWDGTVVPSAGNYKKLFGSFVVNELTFEEITDKIFSFTPYEIQAGDVIGVYYDDADSSVSIRFSTSDQFNGTSTRESYYANSPAAWNDVTTNDVTMSLIMEDGGIGTLICPLAKICFDFDNDGDIDHMIDDTGQEVIDFSYDDLPAFGPDVGESASTFVRVVTGLSADSSDLLISIVIHIFVVFGTAGFFFAKTKQNPPLFIWAFFLVLGGGLSGAVGVMPLLYFFIEVALVVGAVAALIKTGVVGG